MIQVSAFAEFQLHWSCEVDIQGRRFHYHSAVACCVVQSNKQRFYKNMVVMRNY